MSDACCELPATAPPARCPRSGYEGKSVDWMTVAALGKGRLPARQSFRLCRDAACEVVYYGSGGDVLEVGDLAVRPGFKDAGDGLVCYCFLHREADIARELAETGRSTAFDAIQTEVRAGNCACEVRNPSGKCCLGEVQRTITRLAAQAEGPREAAT